MDFYVKVKPCCDNCVYQCGIRLDPDEEPRWYCNKKSHKESLPKERTCSDFNFDTNIIRPTVISKEFIRRNKHDR
jgi:hypothetical protein